MEMKGKISRRVLIAVAAGLAAALFVSFFLVLFAKKGQEKKVAGVDEVKVLVSKKDLPAGVEPGAGDLSQIPVAPRTLPYGVLVDVSQVRGKKTAHPIKAGETLTTSSFSQETSETIPEGYVAVSLKVNNVSGVSGMIKPGDKVDVIGTYAKQGGRVSKVVLQAADVFNLNYKEGNRDNTVTLLIRLEEAQKLLLLYTSGEYTLVLRGSSDKTVYPMMPVSVMEMYGRSKASRGRHGTPTTSSKPRIIVVEVK